MIPNSLNTLNNFFHRLFSVPFGIAVTFHYPKSHSFALGGCFEKNEHMLHSLDLPWPLQCIMKALRKFAIPSVSQGNAGAVKDLHLARIEILQRISELVTEVHR